MKGDLAKALPTKESVVAYRKKHSLSAETFSDATVCRMMLIREQQFDAYSALKIIKDANWDDDGNFHENQV